jgi:hypothetical protein
MAGMSQRTTYGKFYRSDVRARLRLPADGILSVRGNNTKCIRADVARTRARPGHGADVVRVRVDPRLCGRGASLRARVRANVVWTS